MNINEEHPWTIPSIVTSLYFSLKKSPRKSFDINARIYQTYQQRQFILKELAKPIVGTNEIVIFNENSNSSKKIKVKLSKETYGYNKFPDGVRHILIDNSKLFITGGKDAFGNPLNIALMFDIFSYELTKIDSMVYPHAYHSIEFLENYDCFIVIGGENSNLCEIYDLYTQKWNKSTRQYRLHNSISSTCQKATAIFSFSKKGHKEFFRHTMG